MKSFIASLEIYCFELTAVVASSGLVMPKIAAIIFSFRKIVIFIYCIWLTKKSLAISSKRVCISMTSVNLIFISW